jgi:hypothetical protein
VGEFQREENDWIRTADYADAHTHFFRTRSALYYFIESNRTALAERQAIARIGPGSRAPMLVSPSRMMAYFHECAAARAREMENEHPND